MALIDELFKLMVSKGASDLHLTTGAPPFLRIHGDMVALSDRANVTAEECQHLIFEILTPKQKKNFIDFWELDCSYALSGVGRFRVNVFMQRKGLGGVFRLIPETIKSIEELNLPKQIYSLIDKENGLVLVTGPTGSGKSTTLASLVDYINNTRKGHLLTIEDPIEFVHSNKQCLVNQREINNH